MKILLKIIKLTVHFLLTIYNKNFDISLFFSGIGRTSLFINPTTNINAAAGIYGTAPFGSVTAPNALLQAYADNHWTEDNQNMYALYPRLSINPIANNTVNSTYWMRNGSFLRLKQTEIGYTLKNDLIKRLKIQNLRIYVNGSNLLKWSSFKLWDPEMGGNGLAYPLQKVFNFGININM